MSDPECSPQKITVAKAQLSTALSLFIQDLDPFSVHSLACGACEILEGVVSISDLEAVSAWVQKDFSPREIKQYRNNHWNAFKHFFSDHKEKIVRDDAERIRSFTDEENDPLLFQGWSDLAALKVSLPVEAQVYIFWFMANDPSIFSVELQTYASELFNFTETTSRQERKRMLTLRCKEWRQNSNLLAKVKSDLAPLLTAIQYD